MKLLTSIRQNVEKRAAYLRTLNELRSMSPEVARDLEFDRTLAARVAREAVYG
mgnify:CR=1 FL=1